MARWLIFVRERVPLGPHLLMIGGLVASGAAIGGAVSLPRVVAAAAGLALFFFALRLMDECKDVDKDRLRHPERPLPRGLIALDEARRVVRGVVAAMATLAICIAIARPLAGASFLVATLWLTLMYREFFVPAWLAARPLLYAITHQVVALPVVVFACAAGTGEATPTLPMLAFATLVTCGFFGWEVCRKLVLPEPAAADGYLARLGAFGVGTTLLAIALLGMAAASALGVSLIVGPLFLVLLAVATFVIVHGRRARVAEHAGAFALAGCLWAPALAASLR